MAALEVGKGSVSTLVVAMNAFNLYLSGLARGECLARRLFNRRKAGKLSVDEVAEKTGLSVAVITDLERGNGELCDLFQLIAYIVPKADCLAKTPGSWTGPPKDDSDTRFTSASFMQAVYAAFGPVDLDPCAHPLSPVIAARRITYGEGGDGLREPWSGDIVFVNPPFSGKVKWIERAHEHWSNGSVRTLICLVPMTMCYNFFHETLFKDADFFAIKGRPRFGEANGKWTSTKYSMLVIALGTTALQRAQFARLVKGLWFRFPAPVLRIVTAYRFADECCTVVSTHSCVRSPEFGPLGTAVCRSEGQHGL